MIIYLVILGLSFFSRASVVYGESEYNILARNFLEYLGSDKEILSTRIIEASKLDPALPEVPIAYIVNLKDGGYILISTSRDLTPVKAYSLHGDIETLPVPYRDYLFLEMEYNRRQIGRSSRTVQKGTISETEGRWNFLLNYGRSRAVTEYTPDTHLLTTTWNQGYPYNKYLPEMSGENVLAGCVNVATSQVMRYHSYPAAGKGVYSYEWNAQQLKSIIHRPYNWDNMPDILTGAVPDYQVDEVAKLIRDLGIMNRTQFSLSNSGASSNISGFIRSFGYANEIMQMSTDNTDGTIFFETLRGEIDAMRPVLLSFPGHMTVADGYASDQTGKNIHVNMGWGGHADDYYYLDDTVEAGSYTFQPDLDIIYNIKPCSGENCMTNLEADDDITGSEIAGKFDYRYDVDEYDLYLKGDIIIIGNRGYGNQAFYISIYDSQNVKLFSHNDQITTNIAAGRYRIRVSLVSESGVSYTFDDKDMYTVTVTTEDLSAAEKASIDEALDIAPVIYNEFQTILLNAGDENPHNFLIDARDENGDVLTILVDNANGNVVNTGLNGNILSITPQGDAAGLAGEITVTATANGKAVEKSFVVMVSDEDIAFGKAFEIKGIFENQEDYNTHKAILDGNCSLSGYNGYSSQGFYTSVLDTNGNTYVSADIQTINDSFSRDLYFIGASLKQNPTGFGSYYPYDPDNDQYTLSVDCPDADDNVENLATLLGIDLSATEPSTVVVIDVNDDGAMDLVDVILLLQVLSGIEPSETLVLGADLDDDGQVALSEVIYMLQIVSGIR